jgi:hypothetical protein
MASEENKRMTLRLGRMSLPVPDLIALLAAVLVVIGSTAPWATRWGEYFDGTTDVVYVNGTNGDGQVSLALGILAGVLILSRLSWLRPSTASTIALAGAILLFVVSGLIGVFSWSEISHFPGVRPGAEYFSHEFGAAWGIMVVTAAGFVGAAALAYRMWKDHFR